MTLRLNNNSNTSLEEGTSSWHLGAGGVVSPWRRRCFFPPPGGVISPRRKEMFLSPGPWRVRGVWMGSGGGKWVELGKSDQHTWGLCYTVVRAGDFSGVWQILLCNPCITPCWLRGWLTLSSTILIYKIRMTLVFKAFVKIKRECLAQMFARHY